MPAEKVDTLQWMGSQGRSKAQRRNRLGFPLLPLPKPLGSERLKQ